MKKTIIITDYGQTKDSHVLSVTITYYLGLHGPTIRTIHDIVDELQKTAVDCNRGLFKHSECD